MVVFWHGLVVHSKVAEISDLCDGTFIRNVSIRYPIQSCSIYTSTDALFQSALTQESTHSVSQNPANTNERHVITSSLTV